MKKIINIILIMVICISFSACSNSEEIENHEKTQNIEPQITQMKSICELATMQCYYHNVAKYFEKDVSGILLWKKDRKFWVEYSGIVTVGIDASSVSINVHDEYVTITIPSAKVLGCKVDEETLNKDSFIVPKDSAKVEAEHQIKAFSEAQSQMWEAASNDTALLSNAQQRVQKLLEDYVNNIGNFIGKTYKIEWIYSNDEENFDNTDENIT